MLIERRRKSERLTNGSLFVDLASYPFISPSIHQSGMIYCNSTQFDLLSHKSLPFSTLPYCKVTLVGGPLPSRTKWKVRCMSSIYPSVSGERPAPVAYNNPMPALGTSDNILYEGYFASDGDAERVALEK